MRLAIAISPLLPAPLTHPPASNALPATKTLAGHGIALNEALIAEGRWTPETGAAAVEILRQRGVTYSALVASNDDMAIGAMKQLHQLGVKVPDQVSVVGF